MIVNPISRIPRHIQAATELKRRIERGHYKPDDYLPSVRLLGAELGISHNAIQRAIQVLQSEGLVSSEHGIGVKVLARQSQSRLPLRFGVVHPYLPSSLFAGSIHSYIDQLTDIPDHHCIVISSQQSPERERRIVHEFMETGIEGLLIWPCAGRQNIGFWSRMAERIPLVFVDRYFAEVSVPAVIIDWHGIGKDIMMHLARSGYRKCLILEDPADISSYHELYASMRHTVAETHTELRFNFIQVPCSEFVGSYPKSPERYVKEQSEHLAGLLASERYDAIFCPSDEYLDLVFASTAVGEQYPNVHLFCITNTMPTPRSLFFYRRNAMAWVCNFTNMFVTAMSVLHDKINLKSRLKKEIRVDFSTVVRSA